MHPICLHIHQINYIHSSLFPAWSKVALFSKLIMWSKNCSVDWSLLKSHLQTAHSLFTARLVHFNVHIPIPIYVYLSISSTYLYWSPSTLHIHQSIYLSMSTYVYLYLPTYLSNQNICLHLSGRPSTQSNVLSIVLSVCKEHGRHWGGGGMGGSGY